MATAPYDYEPSKGVLEAQSLELQAIAAEGDDLWQGTQAQKRNALALKARIIAAAAKVGVAEDGSTTTAPPADPNAEPPMEGAIYKGGVFDVDSFQAFAAAAGTPLQTAYMSGPSAAHYGFDKVQQPTLVKREDKSLDVIGEINNPGVYGARPGRAGKLGDYQIGAPKPAEAGNYSATYGQALHHPFNRQAALGLGGMGVTGIQGWSCGYDTASTRPQSAWWSWLQEYGGQGDVDDIYARAYRNRGERVEYPTCAGRGDGRFGEGTGVIVGWRDGRVTHHGQNTASNLASLQLPSGLVPIACCVSNSHEVAFFLVANKALNRVQIAVVVLAGSPQGGYIGNEANWQAYRGEWRSILPGVGSHGNISWMKYIGVVDLPSEMRCATSISCSTWTWEGAYARMSEEVSSGGFGSDMRQSARRAEFRDGGRREKTFPLSCTVVVGGKEERMAVALDFSKLFQLFRDSTIMEPGLSNIGTGAGQYPPTFAERPSILPTVIWKETFPFRVTAVRCSQVDIRKRIYITTQEGTLYGYSAGADRTPLDLTVRKVFSIPVGRNVTHIATTARKAGSNPKILPYGQQAQEIVLTSRGERKIQWVRMSDDYNSAAIIRTGSDSRLIDPICSADNPNHTTEHGILTICDYLGGQMFALRYSPIIYHWNSGEMGDAGTYPPLKFDWKTCPPPDGEPVRPTTFNGIVFPVENAGSWPMTGNPFLYLPSDVF